MPSKCPNCGGNLHASLKLEYEEEDVVQKPSGGIKVCPNCTMAVDPKDEDDTPEPLPSGQESHPESEFLDSGAGA